MILLNLVSQEMKKNEADFISSLIVQDYIKIKSQRNKIAFPYILRIGIPVLLSEMKLMNL
jgi:hypothetical protein